MNAQEHARAPNAALPPVLVVMGVAGSGKTTIGERLSAALGFDFVDADDLHPESNRAKMARGLPLDDADRAPWLHALAALIDERWREGRGLVVACSALKRSYREVLVGDRSRVRFIYLTGPMALLRQRLEQRSGHFAKSNLLQSQLEALEEPEGAITVDVTAPPEAVVCTILTALREGVSR